METVTTFMLPWPPSANAIYKRSRGRPILTKNVEDFRKEVWVACHEQNVQRWTDTRLAVHIVTHPKNVQDRRTRDLDNLLKATLDALENCHVIDNDVNIDRIDIERGAEDERPPDERQGYLSVTLEPYARQEEA